MTKSLTEHWREGTLESGMYYWQLPNDETFMATLYKMDEYKQTKDASQIVCLAPVPSYDECRELLDLNVYEKDRKKVMGMEDKIKRLQEQLKEANEIIEAFRTYDFTVDDENAEAYQVKWNVKAKRFYKNRKRGVK